MALMLTSTLTLLAQVTTSALSGKVIMEDTKEEVIGATIQATHEPSGTKYAAVTNTSGRFTIQGMRNGGPYTVTVSYIGYDSKVFQGIELELAETYELNVRLNENTTELSEVVVRRENRSLNQYQQPYHPGAANHQSRHWRHCETVALLWRFQQLRR